MPRNFSQPLSLDEAYQATFLWFDHKGEPPEDISEPAHGSIQVLTETTLARVRMGKTPADQSSVLALLRSDPGNKKLAMFSTSGFTQGAVSVAETQGIALYEFDPYGTAHPKTTHARSLAPDTPPDPPFAPPPDDDEESTPWGNSTLPGQGRAVPPMPAPAAVAPTPTVSPLASDTALAAAATNEATEYDPTPTSVSDSTATAALTEVEEWVECPSCKATHFRNARFCRACGTELATGTPHGHVVTNDGTRLVCNTCGGSEFVAVRD